MANIRSQKKRIQTNEIRRKRNVAIRSRVKTLVKSADAAVKTVSPEEAQKALVDAISAIDRAYSKGVIPRNQAARRKSSLMQRANRSKQGAGA